MTDSIAKSAGFWAASIKGWLQPSPGSDAADNVSRGFSPWIDLIHLLWTMWVFVIPWFDRGYTRIWLLSTVLSLPLFVLLFMGSFLRPRRIAYRWAWAMFGLAMVLVPCNPGAAGTYFMFACISLESAPGGLRRLAGFVLSLLTMLIGFGFFTLHCHYAWQTVVWLLAVAVISSTVVQVFKVSARRSARLRRSESEVRRLAALAERERIGRDLHDLLGHTLSSITLKLELSRRLDSVDPARSKRERDDAEAIARQALSEVRAAVTGIRATDIVAELAAARLLLESAGIRLQVGNLPLELPLELARVLALVLREAITNVARHSGAGQAWVEFTQLADQLILQIRDDGRGLAGREGNGLRGIRERLAAEGGSLEATGIPRRGTRLICTVPLSPLPSSAAITREHEALS